MNDLGYVYFILCEENRRTKVKIGWALDPDMRLRELQCGNPYPLKLIAAFPATKEDERWVHKQLSRVRIRGEWFELDGAWDGVWFMGIIQGATLGDAVGEVLQALADNDREDEGCTLFTGEWAAA